MAEIEYFYSPSSLYAYFGSRRFMEIAAAAGRTIQHRPFDLDRVVTGVGSLPFSDRPANHYVCFFGRELECWSEHRNAPVMSENPTHHAKDTTVPSCLLIAGAMQGIKVDRLAHAMLEAHWRDDADLTDPDTLARLASGVGLEPAPLMATAETREVLATYEANTVEAIERSVFGSPTYFIDGDMFYGQDRLEMVERALRQPYRGTWPRGMIGRSD